MWSVQFDKSLADTMIKQVKTKTTLKVSAISLALGIAETTPTFLFLFALACTGSPEDIPALRRRMDFHRHESEL